MQIKNLCKKTLLAGCLVIILACQFITIHYPRGEVMFADDFSQSNQEWETWVEPDESAVSFYKGGLVMIISEPNSDIVSFNRNVFADVEVSAIARMEFGSNNNVHGIVCRYMNDKNYYGFLISSDGYFGIIKVINGNYTLLSSKNMEYTEAINQGKAENKISAECIGDVLSIMINGTNLSRVVDGDLTSGRTGLIIGSFESDGEIAVRFDDFVVKAP